MKTEKKNKSIIRKIIEETVPPLAMLLLWSIVLTVISLALSMDAFSIDNIDLFKSYFVDIGIFKLNFYPILGLNILLYLIFNSLWFSISISTGLFIFLGFINKFKIQHFNSPLLPGDFKYMRELISSLLESNIFRKRVLVIAIVVIFIGIIFLRLFFDYKLESRKLRFFYLILFLLFSILFYRNNYIHSSLEGDVFLTYKIKASYIEEGFIAGLLKDVGREKFIETRKADSFRGGMILKNYEDYAFQDQVNIVSIYIDDYYDFRPYKGLNLDASIYKNYDSLLDRAIRGSLIVEEDRLANEEAYLTGFIEDIDGKKKVNSHIGYLKDSGYRADYMSNRDLKDFNRLSFAKNIGFDQINKIGGDNFSQFIISAYREARGEKKPYINFTKLELDLFKKVKGDYIDSGRLLPEEENLINDYLSKVELVDRELAKLVEFFKEEEDPFILVFFSGGSPYLGKNQIIYKKLGINMDLEEEEGFKNNYKLPYFIWANEGAKEFYNKSFDKEGEVMSPNYLFASMMDYLDIRGNAYIQYLNEARQINPLINKNYFMARDRLVPTKNLEEYLRDFYQEYRDVEAYYKNNFKEEE